MELMLFAMAALGALLVVPFVALSRTSSLARENRRLRERLDALEARVNLDEANEAGESPLSVAPGPGAPQPPPPIPLFAPPPPPAVAHAPEPFAQVASSAMPSAAAPKAPAARSAASMEQLIGGVWLQNVGAVLVLLGVFFLILWGYATGRFGPGVLVGAGVVLGLGLWWRGDRTARTVPRFGHALIGVGLGVVYLSLYLGHFRLHVLAAPIAWVLLTATSMAMVLIGRAYRAQSIAMLGVIGAFLPQLIAGWAPMRGFALAPMPLLLYLAAIDAAVIVLAASTGWGALNLTALLLTAAVWCNAYRAPVWNWPVQLGLSVLFAAQALALLPRLVALPGPVRRTELAVVALAPLAFAAASWPFLAYANAQLVSMLLFGHAAIYLGAAFWADRRRPDEMLWRPLTGAATLFVAAGLSRALGTENTPVAWCFEGAVLVWLGLGSRGAWLRLCGYAIAAIGAMWLLAGSFESAWRPDQLPVLYAGGVRDLLCLLALFSIPAALTRYRDRLAPGEGVLADLATALVNLGLVMFLALESYHFAAALYGSGGRWAGLPAVGGPRVGDRVLVSTAAFCGMAWMAQGLVVFAIGRRRSTFLRVLAVALGGCAAGVTLIALASLNAWGLDWRPIAYPAGLGQLGIIAAMVWIAASLARDRELLPPSQRQLGHVWTLGANLLLLVWSGVESAHVATTAAMGGVVPDHEVIATRAATLASVAWTLQAAGLIVLGWSRGSAFLRWCGLALLGLVVLKVLVLDLANVDVFWRFLSAIAIGAALLGLSYVYQRRARNAAG